MGDYDDKETKTVKVEETEGGTVHREASEEEIEKDPTAQKKSPLGAVDPSQTLSPFHPLFGQSSTQSDSGHGKPPEGMEHRMAGIEMTDKEEAESGDIDKPKEERVNQPESPSGVHPNPVAGHGKVGDLHTTQPRHNDANRIETLQKEIDALKLRVNDAKTSATDKANVQKELDAKQKQMDELKQRAGQK